MSIKSNLTNDRYTVYKERNDFMSDYERIYLSETDLEDYLIKNLKSKGKALIVVDVEDETNFICELYSYACASDKETWYRCYWLKKNGKLENSVITQQLQPAYIYNKENKFVYADIYRDFQNIQDFYSVKNTLENYTEEKLSKESRNDNGFHFEVYLSCGKCDIENFGASLELEFIEYYMDKKELKKYDMSFLQDKEYTSIIFQNVR